MGNYFLKLAIMQPTFTPWLGYFDLIDYVDKFIFLDTVQLSRRSWQVRNKFKINQQEYIYSLPIIHQKCRTDEIISEVEISNHIYVKDKLIKLLNRNYKKAKYYQQVNDFIMELIMFNEKYLSEYNINIITKISEKLKLNTKIIKLSETAYQKNKSKGDMILDICNYFHTTKYISPLGSKEYLDKVKNNFSDKNIDIYYQYYQHPIYNQIGDKFIPYLGIFDLLYNEGFENSAKIIRSGRKYLNSNIIDFTKRS